MGNPHKPITTSPPTGPEIIEIVRKLSSNMAARAELLNHQTVVIRARYNLLVDKGFTEEQALYLCTQDWGSAL
jgi:hypothetical protein